MKSINEIDHLKKKILDYYRYFFEFIIYKKNLFKKYFNEHKFKMLIYIFTGIVAITIITDIYDRRNEEEKLIGFSEYQNYEIKKIKLPTKGDVVLIKKIPNNDYLVTSIKDDDILITGYFYFEIRPQTKFVPDLYHSDIAGNTPENSNYWGSIGYGSVLLSMKGH